MTVNAIQTQRLRTALEEFVKFQISDYDRSHNMARAYCAIRRRAVRILAEITAASQADGEAKQ